MGLKHYKNLTWQTKGRHDECTDSPRARLTDSTTLLQHPPPLTSPLGIDMEAPSQSPWWVSSGTELDNETNQDSKPPMFLLTAVTRNLAIARFLCESVLVRFEVCFQKFGWIYSIRYFPMELGLPDSARQLFSNFFVREQLLATFRKTSTFLGNFWAILNQNAE